MFSSVTFTTYIYLRSSYCKVGDGFSNLKSWVSAHLFSSSRLSLLRSHLASEFFNLFSSFNFLQLIVNVTEQSICFRLGGGVRLRSRLSPGGGQNQKCHFKAKTDTFFINSFIYRAYYICKIIQKIGSKGSKS